METAATESRLAESVSALVLQIRQRATEAEKIRKIPTDTIEALASTGLFRAFVPRAFGGAESRIAPIHEVLIELGTACTSTAWVASLFVAHAIMVRWLDERAQREVWRDGPDTRISSSVAPVGHVTPCDGGFRMNGRWSFSSGVDHAQWILLMATVPDGTTAEEPVKRLCLVPVSEVQIEDDWHVAGLRATGSKSVIVRDVFIPNHRSEDMASIRAGRYHARTSNPSHLTLIPWKPFLDYAFCPSAIGTALAALEFFGDHTAKRKSVHTGQAQRTRPSLSVRLAQATADADVAQLVHQRDILELERFNDMTPERRRVTDSRISFGPAHVVELCQRAVGRLYRGSGGGVLYEKSPMQRYLRDINAIALHTAVDIDLARERYGCALLDHSRA